MSNTIYRVEKIKGYTIMPNYHLRDTNITLKAKGLLSQMLSLPENWDYSLAGLCAINKESKTAIRSAIVELEQAGYITRRQCRDESGRMGQEENQFSGLSGKQGAITAYTEIIKENLEYDILIQQRDKERVDEVLEIIIDTLAADCEHFCIGRKIHSAETVKSRFGCRMKAAMLSMTKHVLMALCKISIQKTSL